MNNGDWPGLIYLYVAISSKQFRPSPFHHEFQHCSKNEGLLRGEAGPVFRPETKDHIKYFDTSVHDSTCGG